jgi:hypothetical protein
MTGVTIVFGVFAAYALVAGRLDRWSVSAPIVLVSSGIVLGEGGLKVLHITAAVPPSSTTPPSPGSGGGRSTSGRATARR